MFIVTVICFVFATNMIESVFIDSYVGSQGGALDYTLTKFEDFNTENIIVVDLASKNPTITNYLDNNIELASNLDMHFILYNINTFFDQEHQYLSDGRGEILMVGNNDAMVTNSDRVLRSDATDIARDISDNSFNDNDNRIIYHYDSNGFYNSPCLIGAKTLKKYASYETVGTIFLHFDETNIRDLYSDLVSEPGEILIINNDAIIVSSSVANDVGNEDSALLNAVNKLKNTQDKYLEQDIDGTSYIVMSRYIPVFDMHIVSRVDINDALYDFNENITWLSMLVVVILSIGAFIIFVLLKRMTVPLSGVIDKIRNSKQEGYKKIEQRDIKNREVLELKESYNKMIDELNEHVENLLLTEKQKRKAELSALQMQINPHFLYNTLATVKYLAWQNETEKVTKTIEALIDLLQNTIYKDDELIPLRDEINNLVNYAYINERRYGDNIKLEYSIEGATKDIPVPRLFLQPFAENAYFHAFQQKKQGSVFITAEIEDKLLICTVRDDGDGMANDAREVPKKSFTGVGINNVDQRIKMIYGEEYGVTIKSVIEVGTTVSLTIPIQK